MKNTYIAMRHGQTIYQTMKNDITYPWPEEAPITLTEEGRKIIEDSAKELRRKDIDLIFSSDIPRAKESAEIVGDILGIKPIFDKRLRDIDFGSYSGKFQADFEADFKDPKKRYYEKPGGGESQQDCRKRLEDFVNELEEKYEGKTILLVSHGDPIIILTGIISGFKTDEEFINFLSKRNIPHVGEWRELNYV